MAAWHVGMAHREGWHAAHLTWYIKGRSVLRGCYSLAPGAPVRPPADDMVAGTCGAKLPHDTVTRQLIYRK